MCANCVIPPVHQEVLDLSDFDLNFPPVEEDVASIRNVRSALTATGNVAAAARVSSVGGNPGKKRVALTNCLNYASQWITNHHCGTISRCWRPLEARLA